MGLLGGPQRWKRKTRGEFPGIAGIDARNEWIQCALEKFVAEVIANEDGEADIVGAFAGTEREIAQEAELAKWRKERGADESGGRKRGGLETSLADDEAFSRGG